MGELHTKVPCRHYQYLHTLGRKHWSPEEKLSTLVLKWWENLLMYNLESSFQHGMWDLCRESGGNIWDFEKMLCWYLLLQRVRWKEQGVKMIGNGFKFLWSGGCKTENGVDVIAAKWLIGKVVGVERFNDRVMKVNIIIGMYSGR